ncbi:MAG: hypothetical protein QF704_15300 [Anaerolineales bacterium]|jgi:hypothetical protein|nr:hypothetical protein [Anaerolineales bacterium]
MQFEGENWYLTRRSASATKFHPATDDARGSESYGDGFNNPTGSDTFSIQYNTLDWDKIMFAWGSLDEWLILEKAAFEYLIALTNCNKC